jgi:hypothetical protein
MIELLLINSLPDLRDPSLWSDEHVENHNQTTIEKIIQYKEQNQKTCLFVGRDPTEPLPNSEIWVSLSIIQSRDILDRTPKGRLHLIMDFNKTEQMKMIKNLFDLVVVDLSTRKFIQDVGFPNIYQTIRNGGDLLVELGLYGGTLRPDPRLDPGAWCAYYDTFQLFVVDYFKEKFNVIIDLSIVEGNLMYDQQIHDEKKNVKALPEYKAWKEFQIEERGIVNDNFNDMLNFFTFLSEKQGIIDPTKLVNKDQTNAEQDVRTKEMSQCFDNVQFVKGQYPYSNDYDNDGQTKTEYFHASGKKLAK